MPHIYIAAAHKSSGKTTTSIGLTAALTAIGKKVQTFKKGPDYIDPLWLSKASGNPCYNLDFNTHSNEEIRSLFNNQVGHSDISIIEGNKGLYDGVALDGSDSNAAMAKLIEAPVILTIDTIGITRGIAPLLQGYQNFDSDVNIAGIILNKVGGSRHQSKLIAAIEHYTDIQVLGVIGFDQALQIPERHLGLVPANESGEAVEVIAKLSKTISNGIDLEKIISVANTIKLPTDKLQTSNDIPPDIRIAIARDAAFGFYYADDLDAFAKAGAELVPFDALTNAELPSVDGLFIGGGFPETQMKKLSANISLLKDINNKISAGMPTYAECGGLMYLSESISWKNETYKMVGIIPGNIVVHKRPQGRGYVKLEKTQAMPWTECIQTLSAHEFHYASLDNLPANQKYAYTVKRGTGINGQNDGILINNCLANFSHLRNSAISPWVNSFVQFVRANKQ
ncbi:MAG: cobyrinate a,c-diamide synthase [Gammaproteobacteria bacterium]|nr:cobyrinate a,c-diamide synthase [Gammaproteobacteria bacterium]